MIVGDFNVNVLVPAIFLDFFPERLKLGVIGIFVNLKCK